MWSDFQLQPRWSGPILPRSALLQLKGHGQSTTEKPKKTLKGRKKKAAFPASSGLEARHRGGAPGSLCCFLYIPDRALHEPPTWNCQQAQTQNTPQEKPVLYGQKAEKWGDLTTEMFLAVPTLLQPNPSGKTTPPTPIVSASPNRTDPHHSGPALQKQEGELQLPGSVGLSRDLISHHQINGGRWCSNSPTGCCLLADWAVDLPSSARWKQALPVSLPG